MQSSWRLKLLSLKVADQFADLRIDGRPAAVSSSSATGKRFIHEGGKAPGDFCVYNCMKLGRKAMDRLFAIYRPDQIIRTFYEWDYVLESVDELKFRELMVGQFNAGIRIATQMDFSNFYTNPPEIRERNIYRNFVYLGILHDIGFRAIINFNNIMEYYFDDYLAILPKNLYTLSIDANHNEDNFVRSEARSLDFMLTNFNINSVLVRTARRRWGKMTWIKDICERHGVHIHLMATEMLFSQYGKEVRERED